MGLFDILLSEEQRIKNRIEQTKKENRVLAAKVELKEEENKGSGLKIRLRELEAGSD